MNAQELLSKLNEMADKGVNLADFKLQNNFGDSVLSVSLLEKESILLIDEEWPDEE